MYESKHTPGKRFGNAFQGKHYDEMHNKNAAVDNAVEENAETPNVAKDDQENGQEMHPVVSAHGKAHEVNLHHDHVNHKHTVHSKHEDGHENMSEHQSPEEAHEEGGKLAGVSVKKENEAKDEEDGQQGAHSEEDGFQMPPLV